MKLPALVLSALLLAWTAGAEELSDCAAIESATERLDCYDELARQRKGDGKEKENAPVADENPGLSVDETVRSQPDEDAFGRKAEKPDKDIEAISARLEKVERTARGNYVFTLSNGQVWMQNEPGRRLIEAGQDVTIRKHRWHYEMEFEGFPDVPVRRID